MKERNQNSQISIASRNKIEQISQNNSLLRSYDNIVSPSTQIRLHKDH
jgi:hypothetical protein